MVLVSYILNNNIGILQTKLSNGEGHEARRVGLETIPLDQDIEGGHSERPHIPPNLVVAPRASHNTLDLSMRYHHHVFLRANGI